MDQCCVYCDLKSCLLIRSAEGKEKVFCILHMLRIHTVFRKWSRRNVFDLHLKMYLFDIRVPCIKIEMSELLFEKYRMDLNQDKNDIEVRNDDAIKRNQILSDLTQQTLNRMDGLYLREICLLMDTTMKHKLRKKSVAEIEKLNRRKSPETK